MNYYDLSGLSIHKMRILVTAARQKSFKAAASYLHVTQSMVSKTIASLEGELGLQLFIRGQDGIRLTPAGRYLAQAWEVQVEAVAASVERAHQLQEGSRFVLRIGSLKTVPTERYMDDAARRFNEENPHVDLQLEQTTLEDLFTKLCGDELDIIYTEGMERAALEAAGCRCETVLRGFLTVCVHESNPLYGREEVSLRELREEPQILLDRKTAASFNQFILDTCRQYGFTPVIRAFAPNTHTASQYVRLGQGVSLVPTFSATGSKYRSIRKIMLKERIPVELIAAWRESTANPYVQRFAAYHLAFLKEQAEERD